MSQQNYSAPDQRTVYEAAVAARKAPLIAQRPALFSPAVAAQDEGGASGWGEFAQMLLPWQFTDWQDETVAHVRTCYLGDWTPLHKVRISGPQAREFLSGIGTADLSRFEPGQAKHHVQLDEQGYVASEGVLCRTGPEEYLYTAGSGDWLTWQLSQGSWQVRVEDISPDLFILGVQGPAAVDVLRVVCDVDPATIGFNRSSPATVCATPVRLLRTGISGEVGFELHGPAAAAAQVWSGVLAAGREHGIRQLGLRSQSVQHIEAGIATNGLDYLPASALTPGAPTQFRQRPIGGSFVPSGFSDYFRRPTELGWLRPGRLPGHDFLGRDALAADEARRTLTGLVWNAADVTAIFAAALGDPQPPEQMQLPRLNGPSFDSVLVNGAEVGVSSGRSLSSNLHSMISLGVLDRDHTVPGTEVTVLWGRPGTSQREIRATVTSLPFKPDRRRTDLVGR